MWGLWGVPTGGHQAVVLYVSPLRTGWRGDGLWHWCVGGSLHRGRCKTPEEARAAVKAVILARDRDIAHRMRGRASAAYEADRYSRTGTWAPNTGEGSRDADG